MQGFRTQYTGLLQKGIHPNVLCPPRKRGDFPSLTALLQSPGRAPGLEGFFLSFLLICLSKPGWIPEHRADTPGRVHAASPCTQSASALTRGSLRGQTPPQAPFCTQEHEKGCSAQGAECVGSNRSLPNPSFSKAIGGPGGYLFPIRGSGRVFYLIIKKAF